MSEREINGHRYSVEPLPAMTAFLLQPRLVPPVSEAMRSGDLLRGLKGKSLAAILDMNVLDALGGAISSFCRQLPPVELDQITRTLLKGARRDGVPLYGDGGDHIDVAMRGATMDIWRLLAFAVEVNYPDFFALAHKFLAAAGEENPSEASPTSLAASPATGS